MATLRIYDLREDGVLALDLRRLVDLLAPRSLGASWTVSPIKVEFPASRTVLEHFEMVGLGGQNENPLEILAASGAIVRGDILARCAGETRQVIWGQFVATLPGQTDAWVTIRAIDSSFYEVITSDEEVLAKVRSSCKDVRDASGPVLSTPFPHVPGLGGKPHLPPRKPIEVTGIFGTTRLKQHLE
jgi:hypothetical protein